MQPRCGTWTRCPGLPRVRPTKAALFSPKRRERLLETGGVMRVMNIRAFARAGAVLGLAIALPFGLAGAAAADTAVTAPCTSTSQTPQPLTVTVGGQPATGIYSLPTTAPK